MKKAIAFCLSLCMLLGSLLPNGDLHELAKVPALIEHYLEHAERDGLSMTDFITLHYNNQEAQHKSEHQHLPFFQHSCSAHVFTIHEHTIEIALLPVSVNKVEIQHQYTYSFLLSRSIFQPPRA